MTKDQLFDKMLELLSSYHIDEQYEIINELKVLADENWQSMCDEAWADYAFGV